jgi:hypothetical protein
MDPGTKLKEAEVQTDEPYRELIIIIMFYLYKHIKVSYACRRNSCATE